MQTCASFCTTCRGVMLAEQWTVATEAEGRRRRKQERSRRDLPQPEEPTWAQKGQSVGKCYKFLVPDRIVVFEMQENLKYLFFHQMKDFFFRNTN